MLLIDQLVHAFHLSLQHGIGRPVVTNLMEGSLKDVIDFLDKLTSGEANASGIGEARKAWKQMLSSADWTQGFIENHDNPEKASRT